MDERDIWLNMILDTGKVMSAPSWFIAAQSDLSENQGFASSVAYSAGDREAPVPNGLIGEV